MNVLLIDDHPLVLEILATIISRDIPGASVVVAESLNEGVEKAKVFSSLSIVVLDLTLPDCSGITAVRRIQQQFPKVPVLIVSANEDRPTVMAALRAGAQGYVPKTAKPHVITAAVRLVAAGERYLPFEILQEKQGPNQASDPPQLTDRQLAVLRLIAKGYSNKEIAARLAISQETVKEHARLLCKTFGVSKRAHAVAAAARLGISLD